MARGGPNKKEKKKEYVAAVFVGVLTVFGTRVWSITPCGILNIFLPFPKMDISL
jgi:hypothetical protein